MARSESRTVTATHDAGPAAPHRDAFLFVVHVGADHAVAPYAVALEPPCVVQLGRGHGEFTTSQGEIQVRLDDSRMSSRHAVVRAAVGAWVLEDLGSKNKTRRNGEVVERALLEDGDVIEAGHSVLVFRTSVEVPSPWTKLPEDARAEPLRSLIPSVECAVARLVEVADTRVPVLIHGETGAGKEALARALHAFSGRTGKLVVVPCGAIPEERAHDVLLGAGDHRKGLLAQAHEGTLLLDEYGDLSPLAQAALLRALDDGTVTPVGTDTPSRIDLRVVALTRHDPDVLVRDGTIRPDLHARLAGFVHRAPPLRERREDIGLFVFRHLTHHGSTATIDPATARLFLHYTWPRNLRELDQTLAAALALADGAPVQPRHLPDALRAAAPSSAPSATVQPVPSARPPSVALEATVSTKVPRFELDGETWRVTYDAKSVTLKDADGVRYLAWLVERAGVEVHASDLLARARGGRPSAEHDEDHQELETRGDTDAGPLLDEAARRAYKQRAESLRNEVDEATGWGDLERASRAQAELDLLTDELARAVGLGGRERRAGSAHERARVNVTVRIRKTLKKIEALHPALAHHLTGCVRTGSFCCYVPPP